jgi:hypothetical protein
MNKKVLFIYFTQSGQLGEIVNNFSASFIAPGYSTEIVQVYPKVEYNFPWKMDDFFDAMPESVLGKPISLKPFILKESRYDLVVFAYQPWYLSPSIPATSILLHPEFQKVIKNTPVVTLIGSRNMWICAQEKVKIILKEAGAYLVGNISLFDKHSNLTSLVTILYWMRTGKRDKYLGIFPKPGVSEKDISSAKEYGKRVKQSLEQNDWSTLQADLINMKAVEVVANFMFIETRGARLFKIWANFILKKKNRTFWLRVYKYYLLIALFIVAPIVLTINIIIFKPFLGSSIRKKKKYYLEIHS